MTVKSRAGQGEQGRAGQGRVGQGRAGQGRAGDTQQGSSRRLFHQSDGVLASDQLVLGYRIPLRLLWRRVCETETEG